MFGGGSLVAARDKMREWHDWYAAVNEKWGLERGDDIHETGARHKSLEEHNRELHRENKLCREIPEADAMAKDTFIDDRNNFRWKDVLSTGLREFIAGIDGATGVAQVSGGGGTSNDMPWRDKDEDFLDWARRAMRYAHAKHYPGNRLKHSLSK
ncbi:MAG: hypothetical protein IKQ03_03715 [Prevotella sp.]|nr:hypothetical protein [Prevotella sp.]